MKIALLETHTYTSISSRLGGLLCGLVEGQDDDVGLVLLLKLPLHLLAIRGKVDVLTPRAFPIGQRRIADGDGSV